MRRTKVVDRANQIHTMLQRQCTTCQCPAPACQRGEAFTERRVQPLNVGRIDHPLSLRAAPQCLHACWRAIDNTAVGLDDPPPLVALDDLRDQNMAPWTQPGPSVL